LLRLTASDDFMAYVRRGMRLPIAGAGVLLLVGGGWHAVAGRPSEGHHSKLAVLLIAPTLVLVLIAPSPLGADAADQYPPLPPRTDVALAPLTAPTDGAITIPLGDFVDRANNDPASMLDRPLRMRGFVSKASPGTSGLVLARFVITCCAADARAARVRIIDVDGHWPADTWLEIVGSFVPPNDPRASNAGAFTVAAKSVTAIAPPSDPYEEPP
jgi:uncharacterized repeat protein (TIGR03943 family)